jgi:hypothetical protein
LLGFGVTLTAPHIDHRSTASNNPADTDGRPGGRGTDRGMDEQA